MEKIGQIDECSSDHAEPWESIVEWIGAEDDLHGRVAWRRWRSDFDVVGVHFTHELETGSASWSTVYDHEDGR